MYMEIVIDVGYKNLRDIGRDAAEVHSRLQSCQKFE